MLSAYRDGKHFAYPGWRLTVPGGPAGGHYKGFTHTESRGTDILPNDQFEQDREDGMSAHDTAHANQRNPYGVYRSSAEVPPRPNASGHAHTYRGYQTEKHAGTAVAPGSFPSDYFETLEDAFLPDSVAAAALGIMPELMNRGAFTNGGPPMPGPMPFPVVWRPNIVSCPTSMAPPPRGYHYESAGTDANGCAITHLVADPATGATSVVNKPPSSPLPLPPAPSIPVAVAPPVSPTPAPIVATNQVVPLNDGSGNYLNLSTGTVVPASSVTQNPATGQLIATTAVAGSGVVANAMSWLEQPSSLWAAIPNWGLVAGAAVLASMLLKGKR
jgi:hypothetical protein